MQYFVLDTYTSTSSVFAAAGQTSQNSGCQLRAVASGALHQLQVCARRASSPVQQLCLGKLTNLDTHLFTH